MAAIRTVMVTMSPIFRDLIAELMASHVDVEVVGELDTRDGLEQRLQALGPDLVLIGLRRDEGDEIGLSLVRLLPNAKVIAFSSDARHAFVHRMQPQRTALLDVSPRMLLDTIMGQSTGSDPVIGFRSSPHSFLDPQTDSSAHRPRDALTAPAGNRAKSTNPMWIKTLNAAAWRSSIMSPTESSEGQEEVGGEEGGEEQVEEAEEASGAHKPVSYTIPTAKPKPPTKPPSKRPAGGEGDEDGEGDEFPSEAGEYGGEAGEEGGEAGEYGEAGEESQFEADGIEAGWEEADLTEAAAEEAEEEFVTDAEFGSLTSENQQEFFAALLPALLPAIKALAPSLAKLGLGAASRVLGRRKRKRGRETGEEAYGEEADFERALDQLEVIIGKDDRVQIRKTNKVPWKRICHLQIEAKDGSKFLGSGALIGPRTVSTAGHCVYLHGAGGWPKSITVTPGRNGTSRPYGQAKAAKLHTVLGWKDNKKREYDYGAITLAPGIKMSPPSAFGFDALGDSALKGRRLNLGGYPGDKPPGTMWFHGRKVKAIKPRVLVYEVDTMGGQSGSAVWLSRSGKRIMVGIHTNGASSGNSATRITKPVFANLKKWRAL